VASLSQRGRKLAGAAIVGGAIGVLAAMLAIMRPAWLERGEFVTYDWRVRASADPANASPDVIVVDVADGDMRDVEEQMALTWPWPRALFGYIADYIVKGGAEAVMLDWIFQDRGVWGVDDLEEFSDAMRENGRTVVGMVTRWHGEEAPAEDHSNRQLLRVTETATAHEAIRAGVKLLAWNARVYLAGDGPVAVYVAGADADKAMETWQRLSAIEALEELFEGADSELGATPPAPARTVLDLHARELTGEEIVRQRTARPVAVSSDVALPEVVDQPPLAIVASAAPALGSVSQQNDPDGVVRRHAYFFRRGERVYPSLPMAAFLLAHPDAQPRFEDRVLHIEGRSLPVEADGRVVLRYHGRRVFQHISAYHILASVQRLEEGLEPLVPLETFKGKYVIVSATARALRDVTVTPVDERQLGATVNALALDNLLQGKVMSRTSRLTDGIIAFFLALLGALLIVGSSTLPLPTFPTTVGVAVVWIGGYLLLARVLFSSNLVWLPLFVPLLGAATAMVAGVVLSTTLERRDKRFVTEALGRYTSQALVDELVAHPEKLSLEWGERRTMSVYFSDIAGFTTISEAIEPEELVALLNDYLTRMTDIVLAHGGVVDKYIGDAVMAFWGAPVESEDHAEEAVAAALEMGRVCDEMRPQWIQQYGHAVYARAGVNTGQAVVGNMGSKHKYNYTVMGDMVNLAARLEGANKPYGTYLMVSETTYLAVRDRVDARELDYLAVKGKEQPVTVYEIIGNKGETSAEVLARIDAFGRGLALYRKQDFEGAIACFEEALPDPPSQQFLERCRHFQHEPPDPSWNGVWVMKEK
jgi:adenylate cyclase